jgi:hypothetical protein
LAKPSCWRIAGPANLRKLEKKEKKKNPTNLVQKREGINNKPTKLKNSSNAPLHSLEMENINLHCHLWVAIIFLLCSSFLKIQCNFIHRV